MNTRFYLAVTGLSFLVCNSVAAVEQKDCSIEFKVNSAVLLENKDELDSCLEEFNGTNIESVTIVGSATKSGSIKRNKELAYERALTVSRIIKAKFPNASIKIISVGANEEIGKKTNVHFVVTNQSELKERSKIQGKLDVLEQRNSALEAELQRKETPPPDENLASQSAEYNRGKENEGKSFFDENPNVRAAARLGIDSTRQNQQRNYMSAGGEISWLSRDNFARPELGVKASTSIDGVKIDGDSVSRVSNAYGFAGVGATALGLVGGVRLLVGGEWIDIAKDVPIQDQYAIGGEARLGYEWKRGMSFFVSYGLTEHLQMVGLDLGVSL